jgi:hypothetical protein
MSFYDIVDAYFGVKYVALVAIILAVMLSTILI